MASIHEGSQYREKALKMYPWVCGRCGREFEGKNLRQLTVHHRDHNHQNNPADGSNWELLCIYCHENEHRRFLEADAHGGSLVEDEPEPAMSQPFAKLKTLLEQQDDNS